MVSELIMNRIVIIDLIKSKDFKKEKINKILERKQDSLKRKLIKLIIKIDRKIKINCKKFSNK